jgi:hypothetical protein
VSLSFCSWAWRVADARGRKSFPHVQQMEIIDPGPDSNWNTEWSRCVNLGFRVLREVGNSAPGDGARNKGG